MAERTTSDLIDRVRAKMEREAVTQKNLAARLRVSQGHLSKLLAKTSTPRRGLANALARWADAEKDDQESLLALIQLASGGTERGMRLLTRLMHSDVELRAVPHRTQRRERRRVPPKG